MRWQQRPHVAAIVCTIARPEGLYKCVESLLRSAYEPFEVIVVDQDASGRSRAAIQSFIDTDPRLKHIYTPIAGKTRAQNLAIASSAAEVFALTDDDCVVPPNWIESIVEAFDAESDAEMLYGPVAKPRLQQQAGLIIPDLRIPTRQRLSLRDGVQIHGMGCNLAVRRTLFERIGFFDEILGVGGPLKASGEDFDFQYRALIGGAVVLLRPEISIEHYGGRSRAQWTSDLQTYGRGDGAFFLKHMRCGDLRALRMFSTWLVRTSVRELLHASGVRRRWSRAPYLRGCFEGMLDSRRFPIDKRLRVYQPLTFADGVSLP
jgi:GT2 family glycosyltransferase